MPLPSHVSDPLSFELLLGVAELAVSAGPPVHMA
jgi:hypothetical protein